MKNKEKTKEKKTKPKLNEGCLKIFKFIELLYEDKADYNSVIEIFKDEINEQSTNNIQVNLNEYANTLKIFGIKIKKEKNKFKLLSSLYSMPYTLDDIKSINILINSMKNFPDKEITDEVEKFLDVITFRMDSEAQNTLQVLNQTNGYDFSFYYANMREQIEKCEEICKEKYIFNIIYTKNNKEIKCKCTPKEVIYDSKTVYLRIHDPSKRQNYEISLSNILSISRLPQVAKETELNTTAVFKVKNRLAKTYQLKDNEASDGFDEFGNHIIVNRTGNFDSLINRLMRYGENCEVCTPKYLREQMIQTINDTLKQYEE